MNVNRMIELTDKLTPTQPGAGAAVEMACIELTCQKLGVPLYTYLGGAVEDRVLFNGWIGELPPEEAATEAKRWLKAGFKSAKIKVGSGVEKDRDRVAAVREVVGKDFKLRIDANTQYDADTLVWTTGVVANPILRAFGFPTDDRGRIVVLVGEHLLGAQLERDAGATEVAVDDLRAAAALGVTRPLHRGRPLHCRRPLEGQTLVGGEGPPLPWCEPVIGQRTDPHGAWHECDPQCAGQWQPARRRPH